MDEKGITECWIWKRDRKGNIFTEETFLFFQLDTNLESPGGREPFCLHQIGPWTYLGGHFLNDGCGRAQSTVGRAPLSPQGYIKNNLSKPQEQSKKSSSSMVSA